MRCIKLVRVCFIRWRLKSPVLFVCLFVLVSFSERDGLSTESVQGLSLTFEGVHDVHGRDGLSSGVLGVSNGVANDVFEEDLEDTAGFFVDQTGNTLHTTSTRETTDGGFGDTLDIVTKDLSVTLGASLSESLSSFSSAGHGVSLLDLLSLEFNVSAFCETKMNRTR
mmetsp:Transcript_25053/g.58755  ORF Transcript_25053/g.58755 Transcript_25053/m.58755 type:complete len:167 (-) Transcript_25053:23-523(-)